MTVQRFAFAIFDDTDFGTVENLRPVYDLLADLGVPVTKSVWPLPSDPNGVSGDTLDRPEYLRFVHELRARGCEVALHGVRNHHSVRQQIVDGLERFKDEFGSYPKIHCNHSTNRDNLYWEVDRLSSRARRTAYRIATRFKMNGSDGHDPASPHFWGDLCREHITYVRNLVFDDLDLNPVNPTMPYRDPRRPFVNHWFSSVDGGTVSRFCSKITESQQDLLEANSGVCVMYAHLGAGFAGPDGVHPGFERLMRRLAAKNGRFATVGDTLDDLRVARGNPVISSSELRQMEMKWMRSKYRGGKVLVGR